MILNTSKLTIFVLISFVHFVFAGMSEKQMKSTAKLMRNSCQPKHKVTDAAITDMHNGVWNEDPAAQCYMHCVLVMMKVVKKNGEFDWDAGFAALESLPDARVEPTKKSMTVCKEKVTFDGNKCEAAWKAAQCIYRDNPDNYFLP